MKGFKRMLSSFLVWIFHQDLHFTHLVG